jgi:PilZ domain-containing protein
VPNPDRGDVIEAAAGERIVAFTRSGKPPGFPVLMADWARSGLANTQGIQHLATVSKARWDRDYGLRTSEMALATKKKREVRKSLRQPGWLILDGGFAARRCVVQNMSSTGAKITIDDPNMLPAKLRLAFTRDARTGRPCEVVWRRGKSVGVKFVR